MEPSTRVHQSRTTALNYSHWSYNILQSRLRVMPCRFYDCRALQSRAKQFPNHDVVVKRSEQQLHSRFSREDLEPPQLPLVIKMLPGLTDLGLYSCGPSNVFRESYVKVPEIPPLLWSIMQRGALCREEMKPSTMVVA